MKIQITFSQDEAIQDLAWDQKMSRGFNIKKGAKVGKSNGLTILLDTETYDYMYQVMIYITLKMMFICWLVVLKGCHMHLVIIVFSCKSFFTNFPLQLKASEGFKLAVQHHLDQPSMQVHELDISPGFETQVRMSNMVETEKGVFAGGNYPHSVHHLKGSSRQV